MMTLEPFHPDHVAGVRAVPDDYADVFDDAENLSLLQAHDVWAIRDGDKTVHVFGCGPIGDIVFGWGIFTEYAKPHHVVGVARILRKILQTDGNLEGHVPADLPDGIRWARLLGMVPGEEIEHNGKRVIRMRKSWEEEQ